MNESRGQFLVEQEGGCWHEADPKNPDECLKCKKAFQKQNYEPYNCELDNPDFSKWENFGRLLELAEMGGIVIRIEFGDLYPIGLQKWYVRADSFTDSYINPSGVPNSLATLIAKALGWKR